MHLSLPNTSQPLLLWEKIQITVGEDEKKGSYLARIEDFVGEGIIISNPEFLEGRTLLTEGCDITVLITRDDAVYQFHSKITRYDSSERSLFILTPLRALRRVQRRQFVRIETVDKVRFAVLGPKPVSGKIEWHASISENVSGNGVLIRCPVRAERSDLFLLELNFFSELGLPQPVAGVCRRSFSKDNISYCGIEFVRSSQISQYFSAGALAELPRNITQFNTVVQNQLVTHIFNEQIELRKKGLL